MKTILNHSNRGLTSNGGFTLLEVVIAVSILTIGLLAIASLQGAAIQGNSSASISTIATILAADRLEKLGAFDEDALELKDSDGDGLAGLDDIGFDNNPKTHPDADHALLHQKMGGKSFDLYWNIATDHPNPGNKTINLIVVWNEKERTRRVELRQVR